MIMHLKQHLWNTTLESFYHVLLNAQPSITVSPMLLLEGIEYVLVAFYWRPTIVPGADACVFCSMLSLLQYF